MSSNTTSFKRNDVEVVSKTETTQEKEFKCCICGEVFKTYEELKEHTKISHPDSHICKYCKVNFKTKEELKEHNQKMKHPGCKYCHKIFANYKHLTIHSKTQHAGKYIKKQNKSKKADEKKSVEIKVVEKKD